MAKIASPPAAGKVAGQLANFLRVLANCRVSASAGEFSEFAEARHFGIILASYEIPMAYCVMHSEPTLPAPHTRPLGGGVQRAKSGPRKRAFTRTSIA